MTKRLVDVDDELLSAAQAAAGTMNRRREAELRERWSALGDSLADLDDEDVMRQAWS